MSIKPAAPIIAFAAQDEWRDWLDAHQDEWRGWLDAHQDDRQGVWLELARTGSGTARVTRDQALDIALRDGWIDGQARSLDGDGWLQRFTPGGPGSTWSLVDTRNVEALIEAGRMQPAGYRESERAKADGRCTAAYAPPRNATVLDDPQRALNASDAARVLRDAQQRERVRDHLPHPGREAARDARETQRGVHHHAERAAQTPSTIVDPLLLEI